MSEVNPKITDAVSQANVKVLADAPAMAMGHIYQTLAHSTGLMFENAVTAQQQMNMAAQAATVQGAALLLTVPTAADAVATSKINLSDLPSLIAALTAVTNGGGGGGGKTDANTNSSFTSNTTVKVDEP